MHKEAIKPDKEEVIVDDPQATEETDGPMDRNGLGVLRWRNGIY